MTVEKSVVSATEQEINALMALHPKGFDLSLDRITRLLERLGNPHQRLPPVIHIAGTNGKGSAGAFCRAILEAHGLNVHVHTSPHLVNWHERYRLGAEGGGQLVADDVLADAVRRVAEANQGETITVFEILTAVMFVLVFRTPCGCGNHRSGPWRPVRCHQCDFKPGRGADHVDFARPSGLSWRPGGADRGREGRDHQSRCPVVIGAQSEEAACDVLISIADRLRCPISVYGQDLFRAGRERPSRLSG
jgi:dihydrofolate synthase/folylpolyglutamate synthase